MIETKKGITKETKFIILNNKKINNKKLNSKCKAFEFMRNSVRSVMITTQKIQLRSFYKAGALIKIVFKSAITS